jgi:hypothetical protein
LFFWLRLRIRWEHDQAAIDRLLREFAVGPLGMSARLPLRLLAQGFAAPPLCLNDERLAELLERCNAAVYGRRTFDFPSWKHELLQCLASFRPDCKRPDKRRESELPALNP